MHSSRSYDAVIRVYDAAGNVIETQYETFELVENAGQYQKTRWRHLW